MSDDYQRIELITGAVRRRHWTTEQKLQIIEESFQPGETVSSVARRRGVAPNLLYRWRRLMTEGGAAAVGSDEPVVGSSEVRRLEERVRELERMLGRKTMEVEIFREALAKSEFKKTELAALVAAEGRFPMKAVADALEVARSHLHEKVRRLAKPRGSYRKPDDGDLLPLIRRLVDERPTYGYRRITALANRELVKTGKPMANHKRIFRIMRQNGMLLARHTGRRKGRLHDGKVVVMRSNLRWCSDGFEISCWNGDLVRLAFIIDAHDREIIAWHAVANAGISGSMVRDMMLEAVESRFAAIQAPHALEWLTDNGSVYTAHETRAFATALNLVPCFTPIQSPESNGISESFVKTFKRDYVRVNPLPDAITALRQIAGWFLDYNENHPHSGLKMRSPREFMRAQSQ
ncbi:MAG TPA: IS3 family transposase [Candidatus Saccharimonadia bacterium]|nr:IS3 family transposase [Candidatus Saccharimonadia bacterium]